MAMISNDWLPALDQEFHKAYYRDLFTFVKQEYNTHVIYPPADDIFNALHFTPLSEVKVLILGQDPYHNEHQAHGLSFSVLPDQKDIPPSLQNIYKELQDDLGCKIPNNGYLKKWADQGVLLLNTVLTVRAQHRTYGAGASGKFPSGKRMGTVYRCNHSGSQCTGSPDRLYALGQTGTKQDPDAHKPEASDPEGSASESAFCVPRILWVQAFQPGKRVS